LFLSIEPLASALIIPGIERLIEVPWSTANSQLTILDLHIDRAMLMLAVFRLCFSCAVPEPGCELSTN
jgi:hypothetical protein